MTFKSEFHGNERDRSGTATFKVGDVERVITMNAEDFNAVAQLLNAADGHGYQRAVRAFSAKAAQWCREEEWK